MKSPTTCGCLSACQTGFPQFPTRSAFKYDLSWNSPNYSDSSLKFHLSQTCQSLPNSMISRAQSDGVTSSNCAISTSLQTLFLKSLHPVLTMILFGGHKRAKNNCVLERLTVSFRLCVRCYEDCLTPGFRSLRWSHWVHLIFPASLLCVYLPQNLQLSTQFQ